MRVTNHLLAGDGSFLPVGDLNIFDLAKLVEAEYAVIRPRVQEIPRRFFFGRRKPGGCCGVGFANISYFHPYLGKISNLTSIFQVGRNHQLVIVKGFFFGDEALHSESLINHEIRIPLLSSESCLLNSGLYFMVYCNPFISG